MNAPTEDIAPGKLNLGLRVLGRRADGYHDLDTLVLPLASGFVDRLAITGVNDATQFRTLSLSLEVFGPPELRQGVPEDERNLAMIATSTLAEAVGARGFAEIALRKGVPAAAGLGGGSSDAAAVLRILNGVWGCDLPPHELRELAARVGSDVPALLLGRPMAVSGRGEEIEPLAAPSLRVVVAPFDFQVSTADAFAWWDEDDGLTGDPVDGVAKALAEGAVGTVGETASNDLQGPVTRRHPRVGEGIEALRKVGAVGPMMSGSGPTVFGLLPGEEPLPPDAVRAIEAVTGRNPVVCTTIPGVV